MRQLFKNLQEQWEALDFVLESPSAAKEQLLADQLFCLQLAFWLAKPHLIEEIAQEMMAQTTACPVILCNCMLILAELNALTTIDSLYEPILNKIAELTEEKNGIYAIADLLGSLSYLTTKEIAMKFILLMGSHRQEQSWLALFAVLARRLLQEKQFEAVIELSKAMLSLSLTYSDRQKVDIYLIWALLHASEWVQAGNLLHNYPLELLSHESTLLHFLYGCWLLVSEGEEMADIHFKGIVELAYPSTWNLASYKRQGKISLEGEWFENAFFWEKKQLLLQLKLLYHCAGKENSIEIEGILYE